MLCFVLLLPAICQYHLIFYVPAGGPFPAIEAKGGTKASAGREDVWGRNPVNEAERLVNGVPKAIAVLETTINLNRLFHSVQQRHILRSKVVQAEFHKRVIWRDAGNANRRLVIGSDSGDVHIPRLWFAEYSESRQAPFGQFGFNYEVCCGDPSGVGKVQGDAIELSPLQIFKDGCRARQLYRDRGCEVTCYFLPHQTRLLLNLFQSAFCGASRLVCLQPLLSGVGNREEKENQRESRDQYGKSREKGGDLISPTRLSRNEEWTFLYLSGSILLYLSFFFAGAWVIKSTCGVNEELFVGLFKILLGITLMLLGLIFPVHAFIYLLHAGGIL